MSKKRYLTPLILDMSASDSTEVTGGGTGQSTTDEEAYDWEMWQVIFDEDDSDGDGIPGTYNDYVKWMKDRDFDDFITPEN